MSESFNACCALILAAGKGTRMKSDAPKVMQELLHKPLIYYSVQAMKNAGIGNIAVVVGYQGEQVEEYLKENFPEVSIVWQREQLGTAHAVRMGIDWWKEYENVLIVAGDTPLLTDATLSSLSEGHISSGNDCSVISFDLDNPAGYGRIVRSDSGIKIVEQKDASEDEKSIKEVNSGVYVFNTKALSSVIDEIKAENNQKEYYLPDAVELLQKSGRQVNAIKMPCPDEFLGVNSPLQLSEVSLIMKNRILNKWLETGVKMVDVNSTWIGPDVVLAENVYIEPDVQLWGKTSVGSGSHIGSFSAFNDTIIEENVEIVGHVRIRNSKIASNCSVGPFVFMRENAELKENVHVGRFVELKKSVVSAYSKVPHLSYIGDTEIGERTNIGAGTITCNYDGSKKHKTKIGNDCFIGSDTILVAPVEIGDRGMTAAGSTITKDVPSEALGIGRAAQTIIENWYKRSKLFKGGR